MTMVPVLAKTLINILYIYIYYIPFRKERTEVRGAPLLHSHFPSAPMLSCDPQRSVPWKRLLWWKCALQKGETQSVSDMICILMNQISVINTIGACLSFSC